MSAPLLPANVPLAVNGPPLFLLGLIWIVATSVTIAIRGERACRLTDRNRGDGMTTDRRTLAAGAIAGVLALVAAGLSAGSGATRSRVLEVRFERTSFVTDDATWP